MNKDSLDKLHWQILCEDYICCNAHDYMKYIFITQSVPGQISYSGVYSPITMKFGMKVDLWTLMTGKLLLCDYLGNGYHGEKYFSELYSSIFWYWNLVNWSYGTGMFTHMLPLQWSRNMPEISGRLLLMSGRGRTLPYTVSKKKCLSHFSPRKALSFGTGIW